MLKKIIFFLAWLGIFLISIFGILYIVSPDHLKHILKLNEFRMNLAVLVFSIIYLILSIYRFLSIFEKKKEYEIKTSDGVISISPATIDKYILELLSNDYEIGNVKVKSGKSGKGFNVDVKLDLLVEENVTKKINEVRNKITISLEENLGISVDKIKVDILSIKSNKKMDSPNQTSDSPLNTENFENNTKNKDDQKIETDKINIEDDFEIMED